MHQRLSPARSRHHVRRHDTTRANAAVPLIVTRLMMRQASSVAFVAEQSASNAAQPPDANRFPCSPALCGVDDTLDDVVSRAPSSGRTQLQQKTTKQQIEKTTLYVEDDGYTAVCITNRHTYDIVSTGPIAVVDVVVVVVAILQPLKPSGEDKTKQ